MLKEKKIQKLENNHSEMNWSTLQVDYSLIPMSVGSMKVTITVSHQRNIQTLQ